MCGVAVLAAALSYEPLSVGETMLAASDVAQFERKMKVEKL